MRRNEIRTLSKTARRAFTLMELLVVIAIIAALMALSAAAVLKFMGSQQQANTKSTLDRTQSQLNKAWLRVKDQAYKESIPGPVEAWIRQNLAGNDPNAEGRIRVIYVKLKLRQAFPMNFHEALFPPTLPPPAGACPLPPLPAYTQYLGQLGIADSSAPTLNPNIESSACLLMALQRGVSGGGIDPASLTSGGSTGSMSFPFKSKAQPGGNLAYLTDAWNSPLYFTRVPVGSPQLNSNPWPGGGQVGNNDPLDPQGYLQTGGWAAKFGNQFAAVTLQQLAGANSSYKQAPMLCSWGQDQIPYTNPITFSPLPQAPPPPPFVPDGTYGDDLFSTP